MACESAGLCMQHNQRTWSGRVAALLMDKPVKLRLTTIDGLLLSRLDVLAVPTLPLLCSCSPSAWVAYGWRCRPGSSCLGLTHPALAAWMITSPSCCEHALHGDGAARLAVYVQVVVSGCCPG